jgi:hypothetical protein
MSLIEILLIGAGLTIVVGIILVLIAIISLVVYLIDSK